MVNADTATAAREELLEELELSLKEGHAPEVLQEIKQEIARIKQAPPKNDFGDLDDLLNESLAIRDEAAATKNLREKLKKGKVSSDERREIEAKVREWEARNVWDTVSNVAVFEHVSCACGYYGEVFSHIMHRQKHKTDPHSTRMVVADTLAPGVPKEIAKQFADVELCPQCVGEKGWGDIDAEGGLEWHA